MILTLTRLFERDSFTLGVLTSELFRPFYTLEPPWRNNLAEKSCVPKGIYSCNIFQSEKYGPTWKLKNVPHRKDIEFHWGGEIEDTLGCIIVSNRFILVNAMPLFTASKVGFQEFRSILQSHNVVLFDLEIK